jgi:hypothetical protein
MTKMLHSESDPQTNPVASETQLFTTCCVVGDQTFVCDYSQRARS